MQDGVAPAVAIRATEVRKGDILIVNGRDAQVTAVEHRPFHDENAGGQLVSGVAIDWTAPNSRGLLRRREHDILFRRLPAAP